MYQNNSGKFQEGKSNLFYNVDGYGWGIKGIILFGL
jgi:hypothetical protein